MKLKQILTLLSQVDKRRKIENIDYKSKLFSMKDEGYEMVIHSHFNPIDVDKVVAMVQAKLKKLNVVEFEPASLSKQVISRENLLATCKVNFGRMHLSIFFTVPF